MAKRRTRKPPVEIITSENIKKKIGTAVLVGIIGTLITFVGKGIYSTYEETQQGLKAITTSINDVSYNKEDLTLDCIGKNETQAKKDIELLEINVNALIKQHRLMGKLFSRKTYCSIHLITYSSSEIISAAKTSKYICNIPIETRQEIKTQADKALKNVDDESIRHHGFIPNVIEFFQNVRTMKYTPQDCL